MTKAFILSLLLLLLPSSSQAVTYHNAPVAGVLSSSFGWRRDPLQGEERFHTGIDIAAPAGSPVYAAQDGVVVFSGPYKGYGNLVVLQHAPQFFTLYGHHSALLVQPGQWIRQGQPIALVGSTGRATGPHLHFEVRSNNRPLNPLAYLSFVTPVKEIHLKEKIKNSNQYKTKLPGKINPGKISHGKQIELISGNKIEYINF